MKDFNKKLIALVLPIAFQQFMLAVVSASDAVMVGMLSQDAMSAVSLAGQIQFIFSLFLAAMTIGASMFAAQYWGKNDKDAVERILAIVLLILLPVSLVFTLCAAFIPTVLIRCFTPDPTLFLRYANLTEAAGVYLKGMLFISAVSMIGKSINITTISGIFSAGGDTKFGFLCDTIVLWCIVVPLGMIAAFVLKLPVLMVYVIVNLDEIVKLPAVYRNYKKYKWVRDLTVKEGHV